MADTETKEMAEPVKPATDDAHTAGTASAEPIANRLFVLILQHPRESREVLATAALTCGMLRRAQLVIGLSWPNLSRALGRSADPRRWAVLHLGSARPRTLGLQREIIALDQRGAPMTEQAAMLHDLDGAVLLDGSWSEAKALWWRNPWLLKLRRLVLDPQRPSRYSRIRREPRREALSTIEATALLLHRIEGRPEIEATMRAALDHLIAATQSRPAAKRGAAL